MNKDFLDANLLKKKKFKFLGNDVKISKNVTIVGEKNISLGSNVRIDDYTIISAQEGEFENVMQFHQNLFGSCKSCHSRFKN